MGRHDEPNEYGFAGGATAPEPPPRGQRDADEIAEREAVPAGDLTEGLRAALTERTRDDRVVAPTDRRVPER